MGKIFLVVILLILNLVSCSRVGIFDPFYDDSREDDEVIVVNGDGDPVNEICARKLQLAIEDKDSIRFVGQGWVWTMAITFGFLVVLFPPYRWLLYLLLILFTLGQLKGLRKD